MDGSTLQSATLIIDHIGRLVTCAPVQDNWSSLAVIEDAAVAIGSRQILALGPRRDLVPPRGWPSGCRIIDAERRVVMPGFVDGHTHLCFAGSRRDEYQERLRGASYESIAQRGGGILATVRQTRTALRERRAALVEDLRRRLDQMLLHGTTTAEVKSGYGLTTEDELDTLRLYKDLDATHPVELIPTFLGAHELPPEFRKDGRAGRARYLDLVCNEMLPAVATEKLAAFCDVFCEEHVFSVEDARRVLERGAKLGLRPKMHCDQFHALGGVRLAADLQAVSVDHLHVTSPSDAALLAWSGTVAVGLPGVTYFLGLEDRTPWAAFRDAGVPFALASDFNPGTCMTSNLQAIASIGSSRWRVPDPIILKGLTLHAARAVGRERDLGSLSVGKQADLLILDCAHEGDVTYQFGVNHVETVIKAGQVVVQGGRRV